MIPANETRTLSDWIVEMLSKRDLRQPDGRNLYQYRVTDTEFNDLEFFLRNYVEVGQSYIGFSQLAKRPWFPVLFVLYGAEWWRRRYDGSGFSWEPILRDLGANFGEWNQSQRSECVKEGLRKWGLRAPEGTGFRFLGAVAIQGGLPMKPLAEARGGVGHLLSRVLRAANNRSVTPTEIQSWVESLQNWLPKSYRQPAIFILLAEVAWTVLTLKQKARLESGNDAISKLDGAIPGWRNQFPLPIEDGQARSLIEQLVREAASVRVQKPTVCLPVERLLECNSADEWILSSAIDLPEVIESQKLAKLFEIEPEEMPRFGEISLTVGDKRHSTTIRKMAGNLSYRIEGETWGSSGATAAEEHLLRLGSTDGRAWTNCAMKGQPLDAELPWIFSSEDAHYRFVQQGSGGVAENEAVIAIPAEWQITDPSECGAEKIGALKNPPRDIFKITAAARLENSQGSTCKVRVQNADAVTENYEWRGRRYWLNFVNPSMAFRGKPSLYRVDEDANAIKASGTIGCSAIGGGATNHWLGPVMLSYPAGGEFKHRTKMVLLPDDASLSIKSETAVSGAVAFENWQLSNVIVTTPNVDFEPQIQGNSLILGLSVTSEHRAPDQISVELFWRYSSAPVKLVIPFPSKGARCFAGGGREILFGSRLAVNQLYGVRLSVLGVSFSKRIKLKLQTMDGGSSRKHILQPLSGAISLEVKLSDYLTDIEHLLSLSDSPDSVVKITLMIGSEEIFAVNIARYETLIEKDETSVFIEINQENSENDLTSDISVKALRLEDPDEEPITLQLNHGEQGNNAAWLFSPESRQPGAWLIYPSAKSKVFFRPTLWAIPGEANFENALSCAINFAGQEEREEALDRLIEKLAGDFTHPCWEHINRLAELVGHLPLSTLDVWRRFSRSAEGMAALAFRYGKFPNGFVSRFSKELPFAWEVIPFSVWKKAIKLSHEYCLFLFGDEIGMTIFDAHVKGRINKFNAGTGGLAYLLGIASMEFFPESRQEVQALRFFGQNLAEEQLFIGESSYLMNLRRIHADEDWVEDREGILDQKRNNPNVRTYLYKENLGYQNAVINAPLILASEVVSDESADWLEKSAQIHLLRTFRAFDPEWFDEAYNLTVVRCLADGMFDN